jgi:CubicO group peptidase (beta-lactamase class C family)/erythromycin esterase-like protein
MRHAGLAAALAFLACAGGAGAPGSGAVGNKAADDEAARAASLLAGLEEPGAPGCVVGVRRGNAWAFRGAYGLADIESRRPNTPELVFGVASVTKQFTAAAAALAARQGYFSLDDDIREFLPELPDYGGRITIRDLVHHTNGLRDHGRLIDLTGRPHDYASMEARMALLMSQRATNFRGGTEFRYGNTGYLFLAAIIEQATGKSLGEFAKARIFEPLGMRDTYFGVGARGDVRRSIPYRRDGARWVDTDEEIADPADFGSGGLMTTLEDYAKWADNLFAPRSALAGGPALTTLLRTAGRLEDGSTIPYAFGLRLDPYRGIDAVWHSGSGAGYKALVMLFPQRSLGVFGFCNNGIYAQPVVMAVADIFLGLPPQASPQASPQGSPEGGSPASPLIALSAFAGTYREPRLRLPMRVTVAEGALRIEGDGRPHRFDPLGPRRFRNEENVVVEFDGLQSGATRFLRQVQGRKYGSGAFERIEVVAPTPSQLGELAGDYVSDELNANYRFTVEDGVLVARILDAEPGTPPFVLEPMLKDEFVSMPERVAIAFTRSADGRVHGARLTYQFGWITDVELHRKDPGIDAVLEWGVRHAVPLDGDLEAIRKVAGDARVLAFGEGTHNAHELWSWRNRLFAYAVENLGFTAIAAETGYAKSIAADDYVMGREVALDTAVRGVFSWVDTPFEENRELLGWMRAYNARVDMRRKIRFYGVEMSGSTRPDGRHLIEPAIAYLHSVAPERANAFTARFGPLLGGFERDRYERLPQAKRDALLVAVQDLVTEFERFRVAWEARSSPEGFERAYRHAVAARQLSAHLRLGGEWRDIAAAENLRWVLEREGPRGRVFLFAHNSHVARWRKPPPREDELHSTMMELTRSASEEDVAVIASFHDSGTTRDWLGLFGFTQELRPVAASAPGSLNAVLARIGPPEFLLDLRETPPQGLARDWLGARQRVRNINIPGEYDETKPLLAYDAVLFVRHISPLREMW